MQTEESLMALACDANNRIWIGGSFSTLLTSDDFGKSWNSSSQDEDLLFTVIQFVDSSFVVAAGEFGTLMYSTDGGQNWERTDPMPNEFYPMGMYFADHDRGWVSGLSGTILYTDDRGRSWQRQETAVEAPLYGFAGLGQRVFVFGDNGTLLEHQDGRWQHVPELSGLAPYLIGGVALGDRRLVIAGGAGTLRTIELTADNRLANQESTP